MADSNNSGRFYWARSWYEKELCDTLQALSGIEEKDVKGICIMIGLKNGNTIISNSDMNPSTKLLLASKLQADAFHEISCQRCEECLAEADADEEEYSEDDEE